MNNFERGREDLKEAIGIGKIATSSVLWRIEWTNRSNGKGSWWVQSLDGYQIVGLLKFLCNSDERIRRYYSIINDMDFSFVNSLKVYKIWELKGKTIKFQGKVYHIKEKLDLS